MHLPFCPVCRQSRPVAARFLSGGRLYFSDHRDPCPHQQPGLGPGIVWCPVLSEHCCPDPLEDVRRRFALFHSLGDNCEFGIAQKLAGAEPLDLLRFAGFYIPVEDRLRALIHALERDFAGLGDPGTVSCELHEDPASEWYPVRETRWNLLTYAQHDGQDRDLARLAARQAVALGFRRRKLLEDLTQGHRVFLWKSNLGNDPAEIRRLAALLRARGPNLLLWVTEAAPDTPVGTVEYAGDGLLTGTVARFARYLDACALHFQSWLSLCFAASEAAACLRSVGVWSEREAWTGAIVDAATGAIIGAEDAPLNRLRFPPADKCAVVAIGPRADDPDVWRQRWVPALARAMAGGDRLLATTPLRDWQIAALDAAGLGSSPRMALEPGWFYGFTQAVRCEGTF